MSMEHKAYEFDFENFEFELKDILFNSLQSQAIDSLSKFVDSNINFCTYPWESEKLPSTWREDLEIGDVHEIGDYALTKFYNPNDDFGLGYDFSDYSERYPELEPFLLGEAFGPKDNLFDSGKMGSYFLAPEIIDGFVINLQVSNEDSILEYARFINSCSDNGKGVYITF